MSELLNDVTVFDFETTGLDPQDCRVIEMAAVRIRNGVIVGEFSTLVSHQEIAALPDKITEITGITTEMMKSGMDEETAFKILNRMLGDSLLVAHNAAFDLAFLHFTLQRIARRTFSNQFLDTLTISRERHAFPHKLENMCQRYNIALDGAHRALNDVHGCWELLQRLNDESPVDALLNRLAYPRKYSAPDWTPDYAFVYPIDLRFEKREVV